MAKQKKKVNTKKSHFEATWKPVNLKQTASGAAARARSNGSAWFDNATVLSSTRKQRLQEFRSMDSTCVDVGRALDVLGEDVSSDNITDEVQIDIGWHEDTTPKDAAIKTINAALRKWMNHVGLDKRLFDHMRDALKMGAKFFMRQKDLTWKPMVPENIVGYVLDKEDPNIVTHYLYMNHPYENEEGDQVNEMNMKSHVARDGSSINEADKVPVEDMIILKNGDRPYGKSVLENVYKTWKILKMLESATVIYRIVRAPERRVWYVDTGRASGTKAAAYVEEVKRRITSRQYVNGGEIDTQYNPASMQEDFFLAASDGRSSRVETLPGGQQLGEMGDVQYFNKKLAMGFRIPPSYLDTYADNMSGETHNDGRLGTAYIAEVRYAGYVRRLQREFDSTLEEEFIKYCEKEGVKLPEKDEWFLFIAPPQAFEVYREAELKQAQLNVYQQAENMMSLSKRYSLEKFMGMTKEELEENENLKLMEKGYSKQKIRGLKDHEKYSLVYGQEDGMGGGFGAGAPGMGGMADFGFSGGKPDTAIPLPEEDMPPPEVEEGTPAADTPAPKAKSKPKAE